VAILNDTREALGLSFKIAAGLFFKVAAGRAGRAEFIPVHGSGDGV